MHTDHAAGEEQRLDQPNPVFVTAYQSKLGHGRAFRPAFPLPRPGFHLADVGRATGSSAAPAGVTIGEDHDHGVNALQSPSQTG